MLKNLRSFSASLAVNTMLVLGVASLALSFNAVAQTPSSTQGKTTGIPEKKAEAWSAYQKLSDEQKKKLAQTEINKKKPTVVNAPTLQQHTQKSNVAFTLPVSSVAAPEAPATNTSSDSSTSNP
jgi:hypothetical protein